MLNLPPRPDWFDRAACRGVGPELFFTTEEPSTLNGAKSICAKCPVREECGQYGFKQPYGVWGGIPRGRKRGNNEARRLRAQERRECEQADIRQRLVESDGSSSETEAAASC